MEHKAFSLLVLLALLLGLAACSGKATPTRGPALGDTWTRSGDGMVMVYIGFHRHLFPQA